MLLYFPRIQTLCLTIQSYQHVDSDRYVRLDGQGLAYLERRKK
ncbi:hypothetical protein [Scytonema hofmannii]|nr:hypothetical protein [Scytonema hofmannii]